ncbi:MAG TPA: sigma-70 family RNA polymerase sigma factor [Acidobacteriaceae bacterium]|jgi:RNA polymerase sigma-70 factor (ECF subfamily)|nr:sigma-70 family RNA polymerase sigma factor [Acidobacteriaceae bacterium]
MATSHPIGVEETSALPGNERLADEEFSLLVYRQNRFAFRIAYALLRHVQDAEDVVQEAFLKLYRTGGWKDMRDERAFLARMVWRMAIDRRRAGGRETAGETDMDQRPSSAASPEQHVTSADATATIHRMIDALPEDLRQPIVLSGIEGMTSREIAAVLRLPEGTVRTRLMRARKLLKEKFAQLQESLYEG